ncbi:MAG: F0F1 ATP synthase subunit delta [Desulfobulbaceae bacterium]|nr:F0F1 ATP synthase subunit delta [Desulfobulbaceae bacterium]
MGIDWFTLCAQIINFLILVWLLKKVLYQPVLNAMAERQAKIAARLNEAEEKAAQAEHEKGKFLDLQQQLKSSVAGEMRRAKEEADQFRDELIASVRREIEQNRTQWLASLAREKESFLRETSMTIAKGFHKLANNTLRDLAGDDLEQRILAVFLSELGKLSQKDNEQISRHIAETGDDVLVTSAFVLSDSLQDEINRRLGSIWGENLHNRFVVDESLLAGIHIEVAGKKIQWDAGNYLEKFEKDLAANLHLN